MSDLDDLILGQPSEPAQAETSTASTVDADLPVESREQRLCPNAACGAVVTTKDVVCPFCERPLVALRFPWGDHQIDGPVAVGREPAFSPLADRLETWDNVSRHHAEIRDENGELVLVDLDSTNGTYHNGQKLVANEPASLHTGDTIRFAAHLEATVVTQ